MSAPITTPALTMQDFFSTTLSANITSTDTVISLNAVPTGTEGFLVIDQDNGSREVIYYTSKTSSTVTCPDVATGRGQGGTTATSHSAGATAKMNVVSQYLTEIQNGDAHTSMLRGGWYAGSGTWTYVSASTFTVPAAEAAAMSKGTRIYLTQTTGKYFVVAGISGTTVTIAVNTDYTLANAAITAPYFSNVYSPVGYPHWFNYASTAAGFGVTPTVVAQFRIDGATCSLAVATSASTSNATTFTLSLPVTAATVSGMFWKAMSYNVDAGTASAGVDSVSIASAATVAVMAHNDNNAGWTASGAKGTIFEVEYRI